MATRFAGDFFGVPLTSTQEERGANLLKYFPELKTISRTSQVATGQPELGPARSYGGFQAVTPFAGFKTLETSNEKKAAPLFAGFKTFEQPNRSSPAAARKKDNVGQSPFATEPTGQTTSVSPEVLKTLGLA
jgi:hypothetical protein